MPDYYFAIPKDTKELNFVSEVLQKMGIFSTTLFEEEKKDAGFLVLTQETNKNDPASRQEIVRKL